MATAAKHTLNPSQQAALEVLKTRDNVFLTGAAGSGKSFLIKSYLKDHAGTEKVPILASTGAAAILVGGRTFHSFFGLGIMEGGVGATVERALKNARLVKRLNQTHSVIIDEVSMIAGPTLRAAETIARRARGRSTTPWGGLRVIAVGDFAQLPPVNPHTQEKEWAFLDDAWHMSQFRPILLTEPMRSSDPEFLRALNGVRVGQVTGTVRDFLDARTQAKPHGELTRLFSRRDAVERFNLGELGRINETPHTFETVYTGKPRDIEAFRKHSPLLDTLQLKKGALVMLRQNDPEGRWVNGSLGTLEAIAPDKLTIQLTRGKRSVEVPKAAFTLLDADGLPVVTATNFPVNLAWAMTIHKAQGTTLDRMQVDLRHIWEPGQAYVALSRAKDPAALFVEGWSERAIFADPVVADFHASLEEAAAEGSTLSSPARAPTYEYEEDEFDFNATAD